MSRKSSKRKTFESDCPKFEKAPKSNVILGKESPVSSKSKYPLKDNTEALSSFDTDTSVKCLEAETKKQKKNSSSSSNMNPHLLKELSIELSSIDSDNSYFKTKSNMKKEKLPSGQISGNHSLKDVVESPPKSNLESKSKKKKIVDTDTDSSSDSLNSDLGSKPKKRTKRLISGPMEELPIKYIDLELGTIETENTSVITPNNKKTLRKNKLSLSPIKNVITPEKKRKKLLTSTPKKDLCESKDVGLELSPVDHHSLSENEIDISAKSVVKLKKAKRLTSSLTINLAALTQKPQLKKLQGEESLSSQDKSVEQKKSSTDYGEQVLGTSVKKNSKNKNQSRKTVNQKSKKAEQLKAKETTSDQNTIFPHITVTNWKNFENQLQSKPLDEVTKRLNKCMARMHGHEHGNRHYSCLYFVRASIVDALQTRRWDNLVQLVMIIGRQFSHQSFKLFLRNLIDILKHYHPAIRGTDVADQLDLIKQKYIEKYETNE